MIQQILKYLGILLCLITGYCSIIYFSLGATTLLGNLISLAGSLFVTLPAYEWYMDKYLK